jgi:hypothetical protein
MKWFMHPLLAIIAGATESELAKYIEYLKVENQILRDRLVATNIFRSFVPGVLRERRTLDAGITASIAR